MKPCNTPSSHLPPGGDSRVPFAPAFALDFLSSTLWPQFGTQSGPLTTEGLCLLLSDAEGGAALSTRAWEALHLVLFGSDWTEPSEAFSEWLERASPREVRVVLEDAACAAFLLALEERLLSTPAPARTEAYVVQLLASARLQHLEELVRSRLGEATLGTAFRLGEATLGTAGLSAPSLESWLQQATPEALSHAFTRAARIRAATSLLPMNNPTATASLCRVASNFSRLWTDVGRTALAGDVVRLLRGTGAGDEAVRSAFEALGMVLLGEAERPPFPRVSEWFPKATVTQLREALSDAAIASALLALPRVLAGRPPVRLTFEELDALLADMGLSANLAATLYMRLRTSALGSPAPNPTALEAWLREASDAQLSATFSAVARMRS